MEAVEAETVVAVLEEGEVVARRGRSQSPQQEEEVEEELPELMMPGEMATDSQRRQLLRCTYYFLRTPPPISLGQMIG